MLRGVLPFVMDDATPKPAGALDVTVCLGQTCTGFGNRQLLAWLRQRPEVLDGRVVLHVQTCWSRCKADEPLCPCVRIGPDATGFVIQAEKAEVRAAIRAALGD